MILSPPCSHHGHGELRVTFSPTHGPVSFFFLHSISKLLYSPQRVVTHDFPQIIIVDADARSLVAVRVTVRKSLETPLYKSHQEDN